MQTQISHSHTLTLTNTHTHTYTHSHIHTLTHTHTHTYTYSHTHIDPKRIWTKHSDENYCQNCWSKENGYNSKNFNANLNISIDLESRLLYL